ncbi:MAG: putative DNA binding domain-containing protein [Oscillospiraceae bacterium]|nr:putative DNA binding domain-containing protein [Oscillospiraceae bacterium]
MVETELRQLIEKIRARNCEEQTVEVKAAHRGCPEKLYDTLSAFSNQDSGGILVFGLDEKRGYEKVGVYDAQDLQKKVMEYGEQMTPVVRPVFTVSEEEGKVFLSAEIPPVDTAERPCFKTARGRLQGAYVRVGDADKRMTEYEVYSYEAFRKKYRDDIRGVTGANLAALEQARLEEYLLRRKSSRPNLASVARDQLCELTGILRDGEVTMAAVLLFSPYPQAYFPQLSVIAACVPSKELGVLDAAGHRFTDSKRIEGTLPEMLEGCLSFVRSNMRVATVIDKELGVRRDVAQYPMDAVREAVLNALVHRDYSIHTEGMPIQLTMYVDRLEISNPGGLYGRLTVDQLGKVQPDTRNPVLVTAMETLEQTENRYSGIPRIRHAMEEMSLPEPVFTDRRGTFTVTLYNNTTEERQTVAEKTAEPNFSPQARPVQPQDKKKLLAFCMRPRSRREIIEYLAISSAQYALHRYLAPLVSSGAIRLTMPEKPKSSQQRYVTAEEYGGPALPDSQGGK